MNCYHLAFIGLPIFIAFSASVSHAQGLAGDISSLSLGNPLSAAGDLIGGAQLVAERGSSSASFRVTRVESISKQGEQAKFDTWSLEAYSPLSGSGNTTFASLDGLANSTNLEFGFTRFIARGKRSASHVVSKVQQLSAICKRVFEARLQQNGTPVPEGNLSCDSGDVASFGSNYDQHEFDSLYWDLGDANRFLYGVTGKIGYQEFEFITLDSEDEQTQSETPWSVGLWAGLQPGDRPILFFAGAEYQRSYSAGANTTICPASALPEATALVCKTGPFNSPKEETKKLAYIEIRARPAGVGASLKITQDLESNVTGLEIPFYVIANENKSLTGGIKAGWRSDTDDATFGVFVGAPFGLYK